MALGSRSNARQNETEVTQFHNQIFILFKYIFYLDKKRSTHRFNQSCFQKRGGSCYQNYFYDVISALFLRRTL